MTVNAQPNQTGIIKGRSNNAPSNTDKEKPKTAKQYLAIYKGQIAKALPKQIGADRFNRICMTALTQNPQLGNCTPESFIGSILNSAQLGLEPNTPLGQAYLIPRKNGEKSNREGHDVYDCTFQIGYKGMIELARRSGQIAMIRAETVYANDDFSYQLGLNPDIHHVPAFGNRGQAVAYYAFYKTKDGDFDFAVATKQEMMNHRTAYSKAKNSPWNTNFDEMAKKTLVKRVLKYAPLSTEIQEAISQDSTVKSVPLTPDQDVNLLDLRLAPNEIGYEDAEYTEQDEPADRPEVNPAMVDPETGEVMELADGQAPV